MHEHAEMDGQVENIMAPAADRMGGGWVLVTESTHTHTHPFDGPFLGLPR